MLRFRRMSSDELDASDLFWVMGQVSEAIRDARNILFLATIGLFRPVPLRARLARPFRSRSTTAFGQWAKLMGFGDVDISYLEIAVRDTKVFDAEASQSNMEAFIDANVAGGLDSVEAVRQNLVDSLGKTTKLDFEELVYEMGTTSALSELQNSMQTVKKEVFWLAIATALFSKASRAIRRQENMELLEPVLKGVLTAVTSAIKRIRQPFRHFRWPSHHCRCLSSSFPSLYLTAMRKRTARTS